MKAIQSFQASIKKVSAFELRSITIYTYPFLFSSKMIFIFKLALFVVVIIDIVAAVAFYLPIKKRN